MSRIESWQLKQRQGSSLEIKERLTENRIHQWHDYWNGNVYVSFSGGKDSTVLLHQVRRLYPNVPAIFLDTGLEYPEIRNFVKTIINVIWLRPKIPFTEVIKKYGYPVISKEQAKYIREVQNGTTEYTKNKRLFGKNGTRSGMISKKWQYLIDAPFKISEKCCDVMKKRIAHKYEKETGNKPMIGSMAGDSSLRKQSYMRNGCNVFKKGKDQSRPMMFWLEKDIWEYIKKYNIPYSKIYDMGETRTGCMFCMFGVHLEKGTNRFQRMKKTHPKQYNYCINKLGCGKVLDYIGVKY
jgi:3'-phosphoadenosine 5'-phosphosulfate sulfotransferase (PAPS reductase)/FAD synthetase